MTIAISKIAPEQRDSLLGKLESHFLDFKDKRVKPGDISRHLSAFSNADGGELYLGITEDKKRNIFAWDGFIKPEDANDHIAVATELFPLGDSVSFAFLECEQSPGFVLQILINKSPDIRRASDGQVYLRRNAQSQHQTTPGRATAYRLVKTKA